MNGLRWHPLARRGRWTGRNVAKMGEWVAQARSRADRGIEGDVRLGRQRHRIDSDGHLQRAGAREYSGTYRAWQVRAAGPATLCFIMDGHVISAPQWQLPSPCFPASIRSFITPLSTSPLSTTFLPFKCLFRARLI